MTGHLKVTDVYVAASSGDIERAQHWIDQLAHAGIACTSLWIKSIASNGGVANPKAGAPNDFLETRERRAGYSRENAAAIEKAQALWFLVPAPPLHTCGGWWEAGYGHALKKFMVYSGANTEQSVFCALGDEYPHDLTAFAKICRLAREGAWL